MNRLACAAVALVAAGCGGASAKDRVGHLGESHADAYELDLDDLEDAERDAVAAALAMPAAEAVARIGAFEATWEAKQSAYAAGALLEKLDEKYVVTTDADGRFSVVHTNSEDYKKEIVWTGGDLYVATRYGVPVHRRPVGDEAGGWRDDAWQLGLTYWNLLRGGLVLDKAGEETVAGRKAFKIAVTADPAKAATAGERAEYDKADPLKAWRATIKLESATGAFWFDAAEGVPLKADLDLKFTAVKDGREARWSVTLALVVSSVGAVAALTAPAKFVESPERTRMIIDRERVLGEKRVDLSMLTEVELKAMAEGYGLDVPGKASRTDLIKLLRAHDPSLKDSVLIGPDKKKIEAPPDEPRGVIPPDAGPLATDEIAPAAGAAPDAPPPDDGPVLKALPPKGPESAPASGAPASKDDKKDGKDDAKGKKGDDAPKADRDDF